MSATPQLPTSAALEKAGLDPGDPTIVTTATWPLGNGSAVIADPDGITIAGAGTLSAEAAAELAGALLAAALWVEADDDGH